MLTTLLQSIQGPRTCCCHTCPQLYCRRWQQWVFLSFLFFPHHSNFFTASFFQLNCFSVGHVSRPPSINTGMKGPSLPYLPATFLQKVVAVSFPLLFIPSISIFSHSFFYPIKLFFSSPCRLLSLNPMFAIHICGWSREGGDGEFLLSSPPSFQTFSHSMKLLSHPLRQPPSFSQSRGQ